MNFRRTVPIKSNSIIKYGNKITDGKTLIKLMTSSKTRKTCTMKFPYDKNEDKSTEAVQDYLNMKMRLDKKRVVYGRFDKAVVIDDTHFIPYGSYVILEPNKEFIYVMSPGELNNVSNAKVKIEDSIEM